MTISDVRLRFFPTSISSVMWENPDAYKDDRDFLRKYLRRDDVFVDVGANIGYLTIVGATAVGPNGKVFAFEANPKIFEYLRGNVTLNSLTNVTMRNCAIGDATGTAVLLECPGDDSQTCIAHGDSAISIPMISLEDALPHEIRIALLKIDVEGYEKFVIEGARSLLSYVMCVYFECAAQNFNRYDYQCESLLTLLEKSGFALYRLESGACCRLTTKYRPTAFCENLIGVRDPAYFLTRTGYSLIP